MATSNTIRKIVKNGVEVVDELELMVASQAGQVEGRVLVC